MNIKKLPLAPAQIATLICFALLGWLSAGKGAGWLAVATLVVLGLLFGLAAPMGLGWALGLLNPGVRRTHGGGAVPRAVQQGFWLLLPFAALALFAEVGLGWEAAGAFASAGIMTASAAAGAELSRLGGNKIAAMLLPTLGGTAAATVWLLGTTVLSALLRGGGG